MEAVPNSREVLQGLGQHYFYQLQEFPATNSLQEFPSPQKSPSLTDDTVIIDGSDAVRKHTEIPLKECEASTSGKKYSLSGLVSWELTGLGRWTNRVEGTLDRYLEGLLLLNYNWRAFMLKALLIVPSQLGR